MQLHPAPPIYVFTRQGGCFLYVKCVFILVIQKFSSEIWSPNRKTVEILPCTGPRCHTVPSTDHTSFQSAESRATRDSRREAIADVGNDNRTGRGEKQINTGVEERDTCGEVPACLSHHHGRHEEAHKSSANTPELSWPFPLCGVAEQTSPSYL